MEMKLLREDIPLEVLTSAGESQAMVEGSVTLPGGLREEAHVLYAGGCAVISRTEAQQDRLLLEGRVLFHALYTQGDARRVNALEATADFTHAMELSGAGQQQDVQAEATVERVDARVSAGQMSLRATVRIAARTLMEKPVQAVTGLIGVEGLEMQTREITVQTTAATGSEDLLLREEFDLPASMAVRDTLYATAIPQIDETTGGEGRMGVTGTVRLTVYHASDAEGAPLVVTRHSIPFDATVALQGESGDQLSVTPIVRDVAVASQDSGEEGRTLRAEVQLTLAARCSRTQTLTVLEDAYTTTGDMLTLTHADRSARTSDAAISAAESGKAMLLLPEGTPPIRQVLSAHVTPMLSQSRRTGSRLTTEGTLDITLLATTRADSTPVSIRMTEPFRIVFDAAADDADALMLTAGDAEASALTADRAELRYVMYLRASGIHTTPISLVTDIQQTPADPQLGHIILYFVQPGDTLWSIAAHYRVPLASLHHLNPELDDAPSPGQGIVVWQRCPLGE